MEHTYRRCLLILKRLALTGTAVCVLFVLHASAEEASAPEAPAGGDIEGAIRAWIWHFDADLLEEALPTYRALADAIPEGAEILVALERPQDLPRFQRQFGLEEAFLARLTILPVGAPVTGWARDRYISFRRGEESILLRPAVGEKDPHRRGDREVASALRGHDPSLRLEETDLLIEGGNVILAADHVIATVDLLVRNRARFRGSEEKLVQEVERLFGRSLLLVGEEERGVPHEHVDMFLAVAGPGRLLLGDPSLGLAYFRQLEELGLEEGEIRTMGHFRRARQEALIPVYESIAEALRASGYRVERLPVLHGEERESLLTWTNGVCERRGEELRVYLPNYGIPLLDKMANERWSACGFRVLPVPAEKIIAQGGSVRCLSNVLR